MEWQIPSLCTGVFATPYVVACAHPLFLVKEGNLDVRPKELHYIHVVSYPRLSVGGVEATTPCIPNMEIVLIKALICSSIVNPVQVHPGKTFSTQPTTTPRRALGDLSNNAKKTPAANLKRESQTLSVQKPKVSTTRKKSEMSAAKQQQKQSSEVSTAKQHRTKAVKSEDLPDIELMPAKGEIGEIV